MAAIQRLINILTPVSDRGKAIAPWKGCAFRVTCQIQQTGAGTEDVNTSV